MGEEKKIIQGFGGKTRRKETLGRPRSRWKNRIGMDLREIGWEVLNGFRYLKIGNDGRLLLTR
jgi:hypothetical protein